MARFMCIHVTVHVMLLTPAYYTERFQPQNTYRKTMDLILHLLILAGVIFVIAQTLPGIYVKGFGTAILVACVYSVINVVLGGILKFISIPFIFLSLGLFLLVINTFLLWLTDQLIDDFEIENLRTTFIAAVIITISDSVLGAIFS